jgi:predicted neutral ceramidase superfamily lipid hydrolase
VLSAANFDKLTSKIGLPDTLTGKYSASHAVGKLVMIVIMIFSVIEAAELLQFEVLSDLLAQFLTFGGQVIVGIIIIMIGLFFANIAAHAIESSKMKHSHLMALVARVAILIITVTMGLTQMGVATDIINTAFTLILGALAVAGAIAFGWGGRDVAARKLEQWWK